MNAGPQSQPMSQAIPVTVLSGFLGSGKTTLLNKLVKHDLFSNAAVIINEFGEVGLDHHLIENADDTIIELSNGCLCCTVRGQLVETLEDLLARKPSRIIIETTGLADPVPVIRALVASPMLQGLIRFAGLYTVFDCLHGKQRIIEHREAMLQVSLADHIILSKLDCLEESERPTQEDETRQFLTSLNPDCTITNSTDFLRRAEEIFRAGLEPHARSKPGMIAGEKHHDDHADHHHHDVNVHNSRISALTLVCEKPVSAQQISMFLDLLLSAHGDHVLRLKGLANLEGEPRPVVIQAVGGVLSDFEYLDAWPDNAPATRLVVFLDGMDRQFVQRLFDGFMNIPAIDTPDKTALEANPLAIAGARSGDFSA